MFLFILLQQIFKLLSCIIEITYYFNKYFNIYNNFIFLHKTGIILSLQNNVVHSVVTCLWTKNVNLNSNYHMNDSSIYLKPLSILRLFDKWIWVKVN